MIDGPVPVGGQRSKKMKLQEADGNTKRTLSLDGVQLSRHSPDASEILGNVHERMLVCLFNLFWRLLQQFLFDSELQNSSKMFSVTSNSL